MHLLFVNMWITDMTHFLDAQENLPKEIASRQYDFA
jgi:hypothetical protein